MLAHLCGLAFFMPPFGNIAGPLLIWQVKRVELGEFVGASAREALNFQFTFVALVFLFASLNILPLPGIGGVSTLVILAMILSNVFFCVMAALRTNQGEIYRYPYAFRPF